MNKKDNVIPFVPPIPKEIKENMVLLPYVNTVYGCTLYLYLPNEQIRVQVIDSTDPALFYGCNGFL